MAGKDNVNTLTTILLVLCRILSVDGWKCSFTLFHRIRYSIWNASIRQSSLVILLDCEHIHNPVLVCLFVRWFACLRDLSCLSIHSDMIVGGHIILNSIRNNVSGPFYCSEFIKSHTHTRFSYYHLSHIILLSAHNKLGQQMTRLSPTHSSTPQHTRDQQQPL